MTLLPYQERVVEEKTDLDDKINKLRIFMASNAFKAVYAAEQDRLQEQLDVMCQYSRVLAERIAAFKDS